MVNVMVIYRVPNPTDGFDREYNATHVPLAKQLPGLRSFEVSRGPVSGDDGVHLIAHLSFDSMPDLEAALQSPEGVASQENLDSFAAGMYSILTYESVPA
jgi:uncharacterized protein (TIGR02118 family)